MKTGQAYQLAAAIEADEDGADLGPTDADLCVVALRHFATRWHRRAAIAAALVLALAVGTGLGAAIA